MHRSKTATKVKRGQSAAEIEIALLSFGNAACKKEAKVYSDARQGERSQLPPTQPLHII
jgi:hypothetical protein